MRFLAFVLVSAALALSAGCGERPLVLQGHVVSFDADANTVVVKDEREPHAEVTFTLAGADVGALPASGDLVRLSYRDAGTAKRALRMMNLTRQAELTSGGGGH